MFQGIKQIATGYILLAKTGWSTSRWQPCGRWKTDTGSYTLTGYASVGSTDPFYNKFHSTTILSPNQIHRHNYCGLFQRIWNAEYSALKSNLAIAFKPATRQKFKDIKKWKLHCINMLVQAGGRHRVYIAWPNVVQQARHLGNYVTSIYHSSFFKCDVDN